MTLSEYFNLGKTQFELDFVDINPEKDMTLFLDPYFIAKCDFPFAIEAHATLKSFFEFLLALLRGNKIGYAREIFSYLVENNDVCMGLSQGVPQGHGMGPMDTEKIFQTLLTSRALQTGIMEDIEDFRIFVPNVDKDKVSDMTANIIRHHLIEYTQQQCDLHNISLVNNVPSGMFWNPIRKTWMSEYTKRLIVNHRPILLVPKRIVSYSDKYTPNEYRQHFVLNFLQNEHLHMNSPLVQARRNGDKYVTKKSIRNQQYVLDKEYLANFTLSHPEVFANFRTNTAYKISPIDGSVFNNLDVDEICKYLSKRLQSIQSGTKFATVYHNLMIGILELLFYPNLSTPKKEMPIHEGRKRIDITFNNSAESGFFFRIPNTTNISCEFLFIECKNYTGEVSNPELDQLSGRFSKRRGTLGILACRQIDNVPLFINRCKDTYNDDRGLIIPITDDDIIKALDDFPKHTSSAIENILESLYRQIIS